VRLVKEGDTIWNNPKNKDMRKSDNPDKEKPRASQRLAEMI
jgi:hypothetical protein